MDESRAGAKEGLCTLKNKYDYVHIYKKNSDHFLFWLPINKINVSYAFAFLSGGSQCRNQQSRNELSDGITREASCQIQRAQEQFQSNLCGAGTFLEVGQILNLTWECTYLILLTRVIHLTQLPFYCPESLAKQVLHLESSVAGIASQTELIMEKLGLQGKAKDAATAKKPWPVTMWANITCKHQDYMLEILNSFRRVHSSYQVCCSI